MALVSPREGTHDENYSPRHRSHLTNRPSQHHPRMWVLSMVGICRIPQPTTTLSIRRTSQDEYTGPLSWMKLSIQEANPNESICCPNHPRCHHLASWEGSWRRECPFEKEGECRSTSVVTHSSIICSSCKKQSSYTCNSAELIRIGTEQLQNKQIIIYLPYSTSIIFLRDIFI